MIERFNNAVRNAGIVVATSLPVLAFAQETPTDAFDTALGTVTTKVSSYAASLVGLAAVAVVFMIGVKYVKKLRGAA